MRLLDRYVIRNFLQAYIYCIAGFLSIWLIFDISDNISTFIDEHFGLALDKDSANTMLSDGVRRLADAFPTPWPNENAARARYNAVPPDLSSTSTTAPHSLTQSDLANSSTVRITPQARPASLT